MVKKGRPRKPVSGPADSIIRKYWREKSAKSYKKNREEVLERARLKSAEKRLREACGTEEITVTKETIIPESLVKLEEQQ